MLNFEVINKNKNKDKNTESNASNLSSDSNINQKIRKNSDAINIGLSVLGLGSLGLGEGIKIKEKIQAGIKRNNIELSNEKTKAESYLLENNKVTNDTIRYLSDDFITDVALIIKDDEANILVEKKEIVSSFGKNLINKEDSIRYTKSMDHVKSEISIEKEKLTEEDKKQAKEKIIDMMTLVENAKLELILHIESDEYLKKLAKEMNITERLAKEHQKVRVNNIKNISYNFVTDGMIFMETATPTNFGGFYAYYTSGTNEITLPYNIDIKNEYARNYFYDAILHEILHESTDFEKGMSSQSKILLKDSYTSKKGESKEDSLYFSEPGELIVRKQILDLMMEKRGIKKFDEKFTEEHYEILLKLKEERKLEQNEIEMIDHIEKEGDFIKIMNELAENNNKREKGNYYNPEWNYDENKS